MKTEKIMRREIFGITVRQRHKSSFFNLPDLEIVGNKYRIENGMTIKKAVDYFKAPSSKEFMTELKKEYGEIQTGGRGRGNQKWVHPFLFIDIALWFSPSLKVKVYEWLYDNLTIFRDNSGDSFKSMSRAILSNYGVEGRASVVIPEIARKIYKMVGVSGDDKWERATASQLKRRDEIQTAIEALSYTTNNIDVALLVVNKMFEVKEIEA